MLDMNIAEKKWFVNIKNCLGTFTSTLQNNLKKYGMKENKPEYHKDMENVFRPFINQKFIT